MLGFFIGVGVLGIGAVGSAWLLKKRGEKDAEGVPRFLGMDARPILAAGGMLSGVIVTLTYPILGWLAPILGAVAFSAGLGATIPAVWAGIKKTDAYKKTLGAIQSPRVYRLAA